MSVRMALARVLCITTLIVWWVFSSMVERVAVNHQTKVQFLYYPMAYGWVSEGVVA